MKEFSIDVEIFKSDDEDDELDIVEEVLDDVDDMVLPISISSSVSTSLIAVD